MDEEGRPVTGPGTYGWAALRRAVRDSTLSIGLVQLPTRRFIEVSKPAASLLGLEGAELAELDVATLSDDPESTRRALDLVTEGVLDGYQTRRVLRSPDQSTVDVYVSVRVLTRDDETAHGLAVVGDAKGERSTDADGLDADGLDAEAVLVVGIVDASQQIQGICSEVEQMAGRPVADVILHSLIDMVHAGDVAGVLSAFEAANTAGTQATVLVRTSGETAGWQPMRLVVARLDDAAGRFGFALGPVDENAPAIGSLDRVTDLEQRLRRIAHEVEAAGVLSGFNRFPDPESVPGLRDLTSRQWEIVTRLLGGERVPTIARQMYLSQSTVRNHLATVFRKVGVHSQTELLELLRAPDET